MRARASLANLSSVVYNKVTYSRALNSRTSKCKDILTLPCSLYLAAKSEAWLVEILEPVISSLPASAGLSQLLLPTSILPADVTEFLVTKITYKGTCGCIDYRFRSSSA
jgi:hypothetical protein